MWTEQFVVQSTTMGDGVFRRGVMAAMFFLFNRSKRVYYYVIIKKKKNKKA